MLMEPNGEVLPDAPWGAEPVEVPRVPVPRPCAVVEVEEEPDGEVPESLPAGCPLATPVEEEAAWLELAEPEPVPDFLSGVRSPCELFAPRGTFTGDTSNLPWISLCAIICSFAVPWVSTALTMRRLRSSLPEPEPAAVLAGGALIWACCVVLGSTPGVGGDGFAGGAWVGFCGAVCAEGAAGAGFSGAGR